MIPELQALLVSAAAGAPWRDEALPHTVIPNASDVGGTESLAASRGDELEAAETAVQSALLVHRTMVGAPHPGRGRALWVLPTSDDGGAEVGKEAGIATPKHMFAGRDDLPGWLRRRSRLLTRAVLLEEVARELQATMDATGATDVMGGAV